MHESLRRTEKWFNFGLWIVAVVFASFLIGLGSLVVRNLYKVEQTIGIGDFIDQNKAGSLRDTIRTSKRIEQDAKNALEQADLKLKVARSDVTAAKQSLQNWIATRDATKYAGEDAELIERTRKLDELNIIERQVLSEVENQQQKHLDAKQAGQQAQEKLNQLERDAQWKFEKARRGQELRIFLYRLFLTLPLLLLAGFLFVKQRQHKYWPFVWGFILFAVFAFFVELVPYLPSYGGYVRYGVGIVATFLAGRFAIVSFQKYLDKQKQAEKLPAIERRIGMKYEKAILLISKGVCPSCERNIEEKTANFCPHCGISIFSICPNCNTRKRTIDKFCHSCGASVERKHEEKVSV